MQDLILPETIDTPDINFSAQFGTFNIKGRTFPENPDRFYKPIMDWIAEYVKSPAKKTVVNLKISYVSTSSAKQIAKMLIMLDETIDSNKLEFNWYYYSTDFEHLSEGEMFESLLQTPFNYIEEPLP